MKRLDNYLLVTDLDGTLYKNQNFLPEINKKAIEKFVSLGGKFTVATGRGINTSEFISKMIKFDCPIIVNGGQTFYDFYKDKKVYGVDLPESSKAFVKKLRKKFPDCAVEIYSDRKIFVLKKNNVLEEHLSYEQVDFIETDLEKIENLGWQKVLFEDEPEKIQKVRDFAGQNCPKDIRLMDTDIKFMEFSNVGVDKGTAILKLADMYGIPHCNVCAIGNYYNDEEMIEAAGIGAVVNDAPADLKEKADFITDSTCADGGFAEFVDHIINL